MSKNSNIEMMRKLIEAKKQKSAGQGLGGARAEKNLIEKNVKVTKQHKKGGLFDGK